MRRVTGRLRYTASLLLLVLAMCALPLRAQGVDSARVGPTARPRTTPALDSAERVRAALSKPPISPKRALLQSLFIPGWGQASLHRSVAGGIYTALEFMSIAMLVQSKNELSAARRAARDSVFNADSARYIANPLAGRVGPRKQAVEDWTALLIFTHLISAADAFVAAHLWDVPVQVGGEPHGRGARITARIAF